jgi:hypothetical protein
VIGTSTKFRVLCVLLLASCSAGPSPDDGLYWRSDVARTDSTRYYTDATNIMLPVASATGFSNVAVAGDFLGNGTIAVVIGNHYGTDKILVSRGSNQRFADETLQRFPTPDALRTTEDAVAADFRAVGILDVVLVGGRTVLYYENDGHGGFRDARRLPQCNAQRIAIFRNRPSDAPSLLLACGDGLRFLVNDGHGNFKDESSSRLPGGIGVATDVAVADLNQDGAADLVINGDTGIEVLLNRGDGTFQEKLGAIPAPEQKQETRRIAVGDVNGDNCPDLFLANWRFLIANAALQDRLLINDCTGTFRDRSSWLPAKRHLNSTAARFVDLNGDGHLDLVVGTFRNDTWGRRHDAPWLAYLNDGSGHFRDATSEVFPKGVVGNGRYIEVADFNGDGIPDLFLASRGGPSLLLLGKIKGKSTQ